MNRASCAMDKESLTVPSSSVSRGPSGVVRSLRVVCVSSLLCIAVPGWAGAQTSPISIGAGMRGSFVHTETDGADGQDNFLLDSVRLYVSGSATETIKIMFNTEYNGAGNDVNVLDAAGQFAFSPKFNVWVGRFLPPSDRANLYGPYYAHHWGVYTDGVQDGYPFIFQGRANGAMYWGQFGKVKVSAGAFDGPSLNGLDTLLAAGRVQVDFWDAEDGYYLNGTYYGDKNLLAIGVAGQVQGSEREAYSVDFLMERKVTGGGAVTVEAEWARYDNLGGYPSPSPGGAYTVLDGGYVLGSYLFPRLAGPGRFEVLGKFAKARYQEGLISDDNQKTSELNLNYIIKQFNARIMVFYLDTRFDLAPDTRKFGVGIQLQM